MNLNEIFKDIPLLRESDIKFSKKPVDFLGRNNKEKSVDVRIAEKAYLTLPEAAAYFGIGINRLREITNSENSDFVIYSGSRRLIKKKRLEEWLDTQYSI